jgi:hypothetical protein
VVALQDISFLEIGVSENLVYPPKKNKFDMDEDKPSNLVG